MSREVSKDITDATHVSGKISVCFSKPLVSLLSLLIDYSEQINYSFFLSTSDLCE
ncbi:MAG: hypothetical protein MHMPM18_001619 [Marteilia pararefringens]